MQDSITHEALEALSKKATKGVWDWFANLTRDDRHFVCALVNAYRTGQLIHAVPSGTCPSPDGCGYCKEHGCPRAQPSGDEVEAVAELQLAAFLAGRGSVVSMKHGTRTAKPAPTMDEFRQMARTALDAHRGKQANA